MFLKQEKPEMDDFERKEYFAFKGKFKKKINIFRKYVFYIIGYPCKQFNIYEYYFVS